VATGGCALGARQDWVRAQLDKWYLFPETLPATLDKSQYTTLQDYLDALTAGARAQNMDRYFTYVTSASEETAFENAGATAGLGMRLFFDRADRLIVQEAFEGGPALAGGIDRGTQILAFGPSTANLSVIADLLAQRRYDELNDALRETFGDSTPGTQVLLRIATDQGPRDVKVAKADFNLEPVSSRYGYKVITEAGRKIGYLNLRVFIGAADDRLRNAFAQFKSEGVTDMIVDLRYNGGGSLDTATVLTDLLGGARSTADVQSYVTFRPSQASNNETINFAAEAQAIAPGKIAFIGTSDTASASEYVMNAMLSYLRADTALIGANTYGKPVGQIGLDNPACSDDRLRVIAFKLENASHRGSYFNGLWNEFDERCAAVDDLTHTMGDPQESSTRAALDFIEGRACGQSASTRSQQSVSPQSAGTMDFQNGPRLTLPRDPAWRPAPRIF
jgi:C-terminal processing protease CtpA/Prc